MRRISLAAIGLSITLLTFTVRTATAHANLVRSEPAAGAVLDVAPNALKLWFSEAPEPAFSRILLFDRAGNAVAGIEQVHADANDATSLIVQLPALKPGVYTVTWRTASAVDGHVTTGGFAFVIGHDQVLLDGLIPQPGANVTGSSDVPIAASVIRWLSYLGMAVLVGGFAFVSLVFRPANGETLLGESGFYRVLIVGWILLMAASVAGAILESVNTGADLPGLLLTTRFGLLFGLRIIILFGIGAVLALRLTQRGDARWWYAGLMLGGVLLFVISLGSHAAALTVPLFPVIADWLHVVAMSVWLGGLIGLLFMLRHLRHIDSAGDFSLVLVRRFSDVATICVTTLGLTGLIQLFFQVGDLYNLFITSYGQALLVKLLLLVPLLGLGALNLYTTRRKIETAIKSAATGETFPRPVRLVMRSVTGEILLIGAVLAVTGILTNLPPAREAFGSGAVAHGQADDLRVAVAVNPGLPGLNTFDIYVQDALFRPVNGVQKVALIFGMLEHDMGQEEATATQVGDGHYVVKGSYISMIGTWQVGILVRRSGLYDARTTLALPVLSLKQPPTSPTLLAPSRAIDGLAILAVSGCLLIAVRRLRYADPRVRRVLLMAGVLTIVLGLGVGATGFGSGMTSILIAENPVRADAASLQQGKQIYADNCLACHGQSGAGDGPVGISLKPPPSNLQIQLKAKYSDGQLFDLITRGIPSSTMPGFGMNLSEQDRWNVINYIETFASQH